MSKSKPNSDKATSRIAPPTTAGSATLNTGHQPMDRKSTTWPRSGPGERKNRSTRLPSAPPRIMPSPMAHHGDTSRRPIQMMPITTPVAINVSTHVYPVAIENAAPELRTNVQVTVSPMIDTGWPGVSSLTASTLVTTSRTSTTAGDREQQPQPAPRVRPAVASSTVVGHGLGRSQRIRQSLPHHPNSRDGE